MQDAAFLSSRRFGGITRLYGDEALARFSRAHVCVVGVGGVGSWAVEALARSGIGRLTLIDLDNVAESNINRQLHALTDDFGKAKVTALRERIAQINPQCEVTEIEDFVTEDNLDELFRRPFDTSIRPSEKPLSYHFNELSDYTQKPYLFHLTPNNKIISIQTFGAV